MDIIKLAKDIASKAHAGQFRRDKITPYFDHVEGVASSVVPRAGVRLYGLLA